MITLMMFDMHCHLGNYMIEEKTFRPHLHVKCEKIWVTENPHFDKRCILENSFLV